MNKNGYKWNMEEKVEIVKRQTRGSLFIFQTQTLPKRHIRRRFFNEPTGSFRVIGCYALSTGGKGTRQDYCDRRNQNERSRSLLPNITLLKC